MLTPSDLFIIILISACVVCIIILLGMIIWYRFRNTAKNHKENNEQHHDVEPKEINEFSIVGVCFHNDLPEYAIEDNNVNVKYFGKRDSIMDATRAVQFNGHEIPPAEFPYVVVEIFRIQDNVRRLVGATWFKWDETLHMYDMIMETNPVSFDKWLELRGF